MKQLYFVFAATLGVSLVAGTCDAATNYSIYLNDMSFIKAIPDVIILGARQQPL